MDYYHYHQFCQPKYEIHVSVRSVSGKMKRFKGELKICILGCLGATEKSNPGRDGDNRVLEVLASDWSLVCGQVDASCHSSGNLAANNILCNPGLFVAVQLISHGFPLQSHLANGYLGCICDTLPAQGNQKLSLVMMMVMIVMMLMMMMVMVMMVMMMMVMMMVLMMNDDADDDDGDGDDCDHDDGDDDDDDDDDAHFINTMLLWPLVVLPTTIPAA